MCKFAGGSLLLLWSCATVSTVQPVDENCALPAIGSVIAVPDAAPGEEHRVYEWADSRSLDKPAPEDHAYRNYADALRAALPAGTNQTTLIERSRDVYRTLSPRDAAISEAVLQGRAGTTASISCVERLLWRAQNDRWPLLDHPTEFAAFLLVKGGHTRVYFSSLDRNGQKIRSEVTSRVADDVHDGWTLQAHLHNHPFMFHREPGDRLFTTVDNVNDIGGALAPSATDVHFYRQLEELHLQEARVTNGIRTLHVTAAQLKALEP